MFNKLTQSQSTIGSGPRQTRSIISNPKDGQSIIKNPYKETLPLKFPKNSIRKQTEVTMLSQTMQNPEPYSVRVYDEANRSRFFEGSPLPLTDSERLARHPQYLFDTERKLSKPGSFSYLARESRQFPIRTRTFEDIGVTNNEKRVFSKMHYKPDPIIAGERDFRHSSSLEKVWNEPRRHRDNGVECEKTVQWTTKPVKREPYRAPDPKAKKSTSYKDMYIKSKTFKIII